MGPGVPIGQRWLTEATEEGLFTTRTAVRVRGHGAEPGEVGIEDRLRF